MLQSVEYNGYVLYCNKKKPLGVISVNGEKQAICNTKALPNKFKSYLVSLEDHRFYDHGAIDLKAISRALYQNVKAGKIVQGGSTITQQLARNILRDTEKNVGRKLREALLAIDLERKYTKDDILNLYLNEVFWGKRNYGLRTASLEYFSREPEHLNIAEQIALLTFLRGPNFYLKNEDKFLKRIELVSQTLNKRNVLSPKKVSKISRTNLKFSNNPLEIFRNDSVPFISKNINKKTSLISTTLNCEIQRETTNFISSCKYPTSIIGLQNGNVIAVGSSNGSDYPFTFSSNVGSTLKPLLYSFLRENGVSKNDVFKTVSEVNWEIREVQKTQKDLISLKEALLLSNNNAFVNAAYKVGIEKTLSFLSETTNKPISNFVPSSILGASNDGFTLYELTRLYDKFFAQRNSNPIKMECLDILNQIARDKFNLEINDVFLKTGTTNLNKERFAIVGYANSLFGFLRQGNEVDDYSKEGGFLSNILGFLRNISRKTYQWGSYHE